MLAGGQSSKAGPREPRGAPDHREKKKPRLQMVPESHCPPLPLPHRFLCDPRSPEWFKAPSYEEAGKNLPGAAPAQVPGEAGGGGELQVEAKSTINTYKFHKMFSSLLSVSLLGLL